MFELSQFSLEGKNAIVTGASRGIGKAIALGYAKAGAKVAITSRKVADLEQTASEIKAFGGEALVVQSHLGHAEEINKVVDSAKQAFGRIDILVNNAGTNPSMQSVLESDERLWETIMNLNLKGMYFLSQAVARLMKEQGGGKIINVSSVDAFKPEPMVSIYSISKAGVRMLSKTFAMELAPYNIQVNTIVPGAITTKLLDSHWFHLPPEEAKRQKDMLAQGTPMGRIGDVDEIVGAAIYLASSASSYVSGAEIIIDGAALLGRAMEAAVLQTAH
jgi:NAD(P)-dependent dehydrogenase (short-subunit alcohol dehydrogenase family)